MDGIVLAEGSRRDEVRRLVGMVVQNPQDQIVSTVVADEVAFGPRNLGCAGRELDARVGVRSRRWGFLTQSIGM